MMEQWYKGLKILEGDREMSREDRLKALEGPLLAWYEDHARILPWRSSPEPYQVWVSEIMLQQTRVEAVKPYFLRFMEEFPTVRSLAEADDDRLMKLWEGLGYYSRARNLKKAAIIACEQYGGTLPDTYEGLLSLPGIGSYTAGAVASIAYGLREPAVDGNVLRVLSRVTASREDIGKQSVKREMEALIRRIMPEKRTGEYNQALIETGAIVCVPNGTPKCGECPMESLCLASRRGLTEEIPVKAGKKARRVEKRTVFLIETSDQILIRKREGEGLLASLYELPNLDGWTEGKEGMDRLGIPERLLLESEELPEARHIFSHVEWKMKGIRLRLSRIPAMDQGEGLPFFVRKEELESRYPLPAAFSPYRRLV